MFLTGISDRLRVRCGFFLGITVTSFIISCLFYEMYVGFRTNNSHPSDIEFKRTRSSFIDSARQVDIAHTRVNVSSISSRGSVPQVDIVYTWVNGSDPEFIADLDRFMYDHFNDDRNNVRSKIILLDTLVSVQELAAASPMLQQAKRIFPVKLQKKNKKFTAVELTDDTHGFLYWQSALVYLRTVVNIAWTDTSKTVSEALKTIFWINGKNISGSSCFYKIGTSLTVGASITLSNQILMKGLSNNIDADKVLLMYPKRFRRYIKKIDVYSEHDAAVLHVFTKRNADKLLQTSVMHSAYGFPKVQTVHLMCNLRKYLKVDVSGVKRFADYGGLKYSLRALDKFAPWVRHVFIVTNGQIPNWLNLANTQVSIIKHKDIFQNEKHLPTFASPAIELNLYRIPGLSDKFVYLNDDVLFGKKVYLKDFYTDVTGEKVRFARAAHVGNCRIQCLPQMVGNGVCDKACNTDLCDWDGDDCGGEPLGYFPKQITYTTTLSYTNSLYDHFFGYRLRTPPQHGPFIVDKNVMEDLEASFPDEWEFTSSQKIRSHKGLQYQFAYVHFVIESSSIPMSKLFEDLDVDDSKLLSISELETMAKRIKRSAKTLVTLKQLLLKCCNSTSASSVIATNAQQIEQQFEKHVPQVTRYMFTHCREFVKFVRKSLPTINKRKFKVTNDNAFLFVALRNNVRTITKTFQKIKLQPRKFVCINDALDYGAANIESVIRHIHDQYELLFPVPSQYELPEPGRLKH